MNCALNNLLRVEQTVENGGDEMDLFEFVLWLCSCYKMKCPGEATTQLLIQSTIIPNKSCICIKMQSCICIKMQQNAADHFIIFLHLVFQG